MASASLQTFLHAICDADDLLTQFDALNTKPPPPSAEVLKRASLVMALAALETYIEDRIIEATKAIAGGGGTPGRLERFYLKSLEHDLKTFHTPSTDRIRAVFDKYFSLDITEGWTWNNYDPIRARTELNKLAKKRGDIAHRSNRPLLGQATAHAVTRDELRKHIRFIKDLVAASDAYLAARL